MDRVRNLFSRHVPQLTAAAVAPDIDFLQGQQRQMDHPLDHKVDRCQSRQRKQPVRHLIQCLMVIPHGPVPVSSAPAPRRIFLPLLPPWERDYGWSSRGTCSLRENRECPIYPVSNPPFPNLRSPTVCAPAMPVSE